LIRNPVRLLTSAATVPGFKARTLARGILTLHLKSTELKPCRN